MQIKRVLALGFFDGVHIGHGALLKRAREVAEELGATPSVISFDTHPDALVKGPEPPLINSAAGRRDIISRCYGIDSVILIHFDRRMMTMPWRDFISSMTDDLGAVHLVVGHDFSCGYKGEGRAELIREFCTQRGVGCDIIGAVRLHGVTISSTLIRELLAEGKIELANEYLGHPHILLDTVRYGYRLGRSMGAPTINMRFPEGVLIPKLGVYATRVVLEDGPHPAVTNVGVRPSFGEGKPVSVESYILDFGGNLYGRQVRVEFCKFLRPEMKFPTPAALSAAIEENVNEAREYFHS